MSGIVDLLAAETGAPRHFVTKLMESAPVRYKHYTIPKKNGGERPISQPAREIKALQRAFVKIVGPRIRVHPSATAYREGASIQQNAAAHAGSGAIIKMDFEDFFPSIRAVDWLHYCEETGCLDTAEEAHLTASLLFHKQPQDGLIRLAIGAPSSPLISNALMFEFDRLISQLVAAERVVYTRYADDMTFSAPRTGYLHSVERSVRSVLRRVRYPKLKINDKKTTYVTSKFRRTVTGLVLANDGRVTIGRNKKRTINASVHKAYFGELNADEMRALCGMLAHVNSVEPAFIDVLRRKYGAATIEKIKKCVNIPSRTGN